MGKFTVPAFVLLIVILIGGLGYFILQNQKLIKSLKEPSPSPAVQTQNQKQQESQKQASASPQPQMTAAQLQQNLKDAVNSKNYAAIATYTTTPTVGFSLMSSGCCEPQKPEDVPTQMEYISDGVPMDFNQNNPKIVHIKEKKPEFANSFIGVSESDKHVVVFTIDQQNKVSAIQLSLSYEFYDF